MGVHESQSLLWERMVALSRPFSAYLAPKLKSAFPQLPDFQACNEWVICVALFRQWCYGCRLIFAALQATGIAALQLPLPAGALGMVDEGGVETELLTCCRQSSCVAR